MFILGKKFLIFILIVTGVTVRVLLKTVHVEGAPPQKENPPHVKQILKERPLSSAVVPREEKASEQNSSYRGPGTMEEQMEEQGIPRRFVKVILSGGTPDKVQYWKEGEMVVLKAPHSQTLGGASQKILNLSDLSSIRKVQEARMRESQSLKASLQPFSKTFSPPLQKTDYEPHALWPGLRDDRKTPMPPYPDISFSILGPDFTFEKIDHRDTEALKLARMKVVSLGHGGVITLKVAQGGVIQDRDGPDFVIYENVFRIGEDLLYQEFGQVGVSMIDDPEAYQWFPCNPEKADISHCAGVVPTEEGGDAFDLGLLNLKKIRYIKIRDTGKNLNNFGPYTEGFDLDALSLTHAFKK